MVEQDAANTVAGELEIYAGAMYAEVITDEQEGYAGVAIAEDVAGKLEVYADMMVAEAIAEHCVHVAIGDDMELRPWIINSGCSTHFSPNLSEFTEYSPYPSSRKIHLGDSRIVPSMGEGTVSLACVINGKAINHLIHAVQYVPTLTYVLLS